MGTHTTLYAQDFYAWAQHQATLIRQGKQRALAGPMTTLDRQGDTAGG